MNKYIWEIKICHGYDELGELIWDSLEVSSLGETPEQAEVNLMDHLTEKDVWYKTLHHRLVDVHFNVR